MRDEDIGRLETTRLRDIWPDEARDFTPWLARHLDQLADQLGIGLLTVDKVEFPVGSYSLDILARTGDGRAVAIENQLEGTDHRHLGQCLTYASGVGAFAVVWVVASFNEEHRSALDWLNKHTDDAVHFFGVELSAVTIGSSLPAAQFRVVVRPNDWEGTIRRQTTSRKTKDLEEFLGELVEACGSEAAARVTELVDRWRLRGGWLTFGVHSLYPNLPHPGRRSIWPFGIFSKGRVELAFGSLVYRVPFDDEARRDAFRERLNSIPGVEKIPAARLGGYPKLDLGALIKPTAWPVFLEALDWFADQAERADASEDAGPEEVLLEAAFDGEP